MKKYIFLVLAHLLFNPMSFGAESESLASISYLETLPREMQKEVLAKITSPKVIQKIALSNKQLSSLIKEMKDNRELSPEVLWSFKDVIRQRTLRGHTQQVFSVALSNDKQLVLTGAGDGVKLWNAATGEVLRTLINGEIGFSIAFSTDKQIAIAALGDGSTRIWDVQTGQIIKTLPSEGSQARSVALSDDNQIAITGYLDGSTKIWDVREAKVMHNLPGKTPVISVALSNNKKIALISSLIGTMLWNVETGQPLQVLSDVSPGDQYGYFCSLLSQDGKIALVGEGNTVKIWDLVNHKVIRTLHGHTSNIDSIALSPDKQLAVSGSWGNGAKIWNVETGELIQSLMGNQRAVNSVALSPDKKMIVTSSYDKLVRIWTIEKSEKQ